ncbi:MAG: phosphoribosylaminoimidazolecarboxamide formyltransferase [Planctomycetes bacterium]|nr:phosphoribosylaminoimidazolecarboxamide formyltransferase [Planctomycetota bacterium]
MKLKYGCNPHQTNAEARFVDPDNVPFHVLNGKVGYINLLDALNAWQMVDEIKKSLGIVAATSFKHVSPAGAGLGVELSDELRQSYGFTEEELSPAACAYLRARGADPSSSFGDFIGLSDVVDVPTAKILAKVVSDGIIAAGYEPEALEILKAKKKGAFIVLQANDEFQPPEVEEREVYGMLLRQSRSDILITEKHLENVVSQNKEMSEEVKRDLILGLITIKYTQSNSVGYALDGQMIGIGAGQQSRVDCTKLAGRKVDAWFLRLHPKVLGLEFKEGIKRQDRINWRLRYVEGDLTPSEAENLAEVLAKKAEPFETEEKKAWLSKLEGVSFVSDAFIPFRDNIDHAVKHGVKYIAHTGGSLRDEYVTQAADEYGMVVAQTGVRLFHH